MHADYQQRRSIVEYRCSRCRYPLGYRRDARGLLRRDICFNPGCLPLEERVRILEERSQAEPQIRQLLSRLETIEKRLFELEAQS